jgi:hypothetical protein
MSSKSIKRNANKIRVENNEQRPTKRLLSTNAVCEINKKQAGPPSKRYKVNLTCVICDGDARGN